MTGGHLLALPPVNHTAAIHGGPDAGQLRRRIAPTSEG